MTAFSSPLLLGFDQLEQLLDQASKAGDGYPPYNIERIAAAPGKGEAWLITLAVAGFSPASLDVTVADSQLLVKGRTQDDSAKRDYLHRGIAARAFSRAFVLAEGMEVTGAELENGILSINLRRVVPERVVRRIEVKEKVS